MQHSRNLCRPDFNFHAKYIELQALIDDLIRPLNWHNRQWIYDNNLVTCFFHKQFFFLILFLYVEKRISHMANWRCFEYVQITLITMNAPFILSTLNCWTQTFRKIIIWGEAFKLFVYSEGNGFSRFDEWLKIIKKINVIWRKKLLFFFLLNSVIGIMNLVIIVSMALYGL